MMRIRGLIVAAALSVVMLSGCASVPADPEGTLDRVRDGVLRVGVTEHEPWVQLQGGEEPTGTEPELIVEFAGQLGAEIAWTTGSEAALMESLERGELDVVLGGFLADTPWSDRGAATRPYAETQSGDETRQHVMLVRMGENGFQLALERFLHEETGL
ncbi:transporter substrate-binding domain-containing protein [Agrococcus baldri]|nr:transporter substrate-binding domain-containing protein [Agrococcus baldri]